MPSALVELRLNRHLLDHEFEGYKLNLQSLPHYILDLETPVDKVYPDEVQYSFVHAKLFALNNHLVLDHWGYSFNYYYFDIHKQIRHVTFESTNGTFQNKIIYEVPANVERAPGHFNLCLSFPSDYLAVVSDGTGFLHIIDTGLRNRSSNQVWNNLNSSLILGDGKYFIIVDSRIVEKDNSKILHCLLQSIEQNEKHFDSVLTWVSFNFDGQTWNQTSFRQLQGKGIIHYAAIETSCNALYIASDNPFKFTMDSEKEITKNTQEVEKKIIYTWLQTMEDITITLKLEPNFDKKNLYVNVNLNSIKVSYAGKTFIDGQLSHRVDSELTTWNVQDDGQVDILLTKSESGLWDHFIEGDNTGEQIMDASLVEEVHRRLEHLCSETEAVPDQSMPGFSTQELEECDAASEEDTVLVRIDATNHQITHRIPLSVNQYLFSIKIETHEVPTLALRHDVDACVWQPYAQLINSDTWPVKHQGTLLAFGYVQSSKQNRKFVTCPPNFSYSVVCEASKHIFIYKSTTNTDSHLRKRTAGVLRTVKVGQQHVFNIDKHGEVLGINATNEFLFVLTESKLIAIQIQ